MKILTNELLDLDIESNQNRWKGSTEECDCDRMSAADMSVIKRDVDRGYARFLRRRGLTDCEYEWRNQIAADVAHQKGINEQKT